MKTQVSDWMTKHPFKIDVNEDIKTASQIMKQECISHLLVFDSGWFLGVLSESDLLLAEKVKKRFSGTAQPLKVTVGDLMARNPVMIIDKASMSDAIRTMREKEFRCLPVVNERNVIIGILTQTDVMKYALVASQSLEGPHQSYSKIMGHF